MRELTGRPVRVLPPPSEEQLESSKAGCSSFIPDSLLLLCATAEDCHKCMARVYRFRGRFRRTYVFDRTGAEHVTTCCGAMNATSGIGVPNRTQREKDYLKLSAEYEGDLSSR